MPYNPGFLDMTYRLVGKILGWDLEATSVVECSSGVKKKGWSFLVWKLETIVPYGKPRLEAFVVHWILVAGHNQGPQLRIRHLV